MIRKCLCTLYMIFMLQICVFAEDYLLTGLDAYIRSDWNTAITAFEKALQTMPQDKQDTLYWLVMAQTSAKNYQVALGYADAFLSTYAHTKQAAEILYQTGRIQHLEHAYTKSMDIMYTFLKCYPTHPKVPAAYYWIGENLYWSGLLVQAREVFARMIESYPQSEKTTDAQNKVFLIDKILLEQQKNQLKAASQPVPSASLLPEAEKQFMQDNIRATKQQTIPAEKSLKNEPLPNNIQKDGQKRPAAVSAGPQTQEVRPGRIVQPQHEKPAKDEELYHRVQILEEKLLAMDNTSKPDRQSEPAKPHKTVQPQNEEPAKDEELYTRLKRLEEKIDSMASTVSGLNTTAQYTTADEAEKRKQALEELQKRARILGDIYEKKIEGDKGADK